MTEPAGIDRRPASIGTRRGFVKRAVVLGGGLAAVGLFDAPTASAATER
jgi:hypothetical protein